MRLLTFVLCKISFGSDNKFTPITTCGQATIQLSSNQSQLFLRLDLKQPHTSENLDLIINLRLETSCGYGIIKSHIRFAIQNSSCAYEIIKLTNS